MKTLLLGHRSLTFDVRVSCSEAKATLKTGKSLTYMVGGRHMASNRYENYCIQDLDSL